MRKVSGTKRAAHRDDERSARDTDIHATGFAFDIRRRYRNGAQAEAFQYMLDRLQALNLIAWYATATRSTSPPPGEVPDFGWPPG